MKHMMYVWLSLVSFIPAVVFAGGSVNTPNPSLYSDAVRADLASTANGKGAAQIGYLPAGKSAVASTMQGKLREQVSVKDYGAVGDGVTDDTAAIQAAHNSCSTTTFCTVVFPPGTYQFTTLVWSPHIGARTAGKVYLRTANASGRTIQVSDQYGRPALYGLNAPRNTVFDGQFYLINTNGSNTATAWSFGGATRAYYCNLATVLKGVETRGFHGGVYEFLNNAFLLSIEDSFDWGNNGSRIKITDPVTNTGEGLRFINTIFGTGISYVLDVNTVHAMSIDFIGSSADYTLGLNKPGKSAPLVQANWAGGHLEWDTVANAYLQNDGGMTWNIDGAYLTSGLTLGFANPFVSNTSGTSTTRIVNAKYAFAPGIATLHSANSATSHVVLDYSPNYQGASAPADFVTFNERSEIGYIGVTAREVVYTPSFSGTIGNGSIVGKYSRIGNRVDVTITLTKGGSTSFNAGPIALGLPYFSNAASYATGVWYLNNFGIGAQVGFVRIVASTTAMTLLSTVGAVLQNTDGTGWGNGSKLDLSVTYFLT